MRTMRGIPNTEPHRGGVKNNYNDDENNKHDADLEGAGRAAIRAPVCGRGYRTRREAAAERPAPNTAVCRCPLDRGNTATEHLAGGGPVRECRARTDGSRDDADAPTNGSACHAGSPATCHDIGTDHAGTSAEMLYGCLACNLHLLYYWH